MKRILLIFTLIVLSICMLTACGAQEKPISPTSEEVRAIIPDKVSLSLSAYPLLNKPAPTIEECLAQLPAESLTFTYNPSDWTEDTEMTEYYTGTYRESLITSYIPYNDSEDTYTKPVYIPADGSKDRMLVHYADDNSYDLFLGLLQDDGNGNRVYRENFYYGKDGELQYYYNRDTGFLLDLTFLPDEHFIGILHEDIYYEYSFEFGELDCINVSEKPLMQYDEPISSGFRFTFYPQAQAYRDICYEYYQDSEDDYVRYMAYYNNDGELDFINYDTWNNAVTYDKDYNPIENESEDYSFFDYLKDIYF